MDALIFAFYTPTFCITAPVSETVMSFVVRLLSLILCAHFWIAPTSAQTGQATFGGFYLADFVKTPAPMQLTYTRVLMEQNGRYEIVFAHSAEFYRERLLELAEVALKQKDAFAKLPLAHHFAAVAVVHCDWRNHFEPLEFAEKYLGADKLARYSAIYPAAAAELRANCPNQVPLPAPSATSATDSSASSHAH